MTHKELTPDEALMLHPISETSVIIKEILNYNRQIVEELLIKDRRIFKLRATVERLENELADATSKLHDAYIDTNTNKENDLMKELEFAPTNGVVDEIFDLPKFLSKKPSVVGTQIQIDPSIAAVFKRQLKDSQLKLSDVCRGMMLLITDRTRYRSMIFDRVRNGKRISPTKRKTESFGFTYPTDLGNEFNKIIRNEKIKQYEVYEELIREFVTSYSFRKLLPEYIQNAKDKLK